MTVTEGAKEEATNGSALTDEIARLFNLGWKEPYEIVAHIMRERNEAWLFSHVNGERILYSRAAAYINTRRRSHEGQTIAGSATSFRLEPEAKLDAKWVEGKGWVRVADLAREDCLTIAAHYRRLEADNAAKADMWESRAAAMEKAGVDRLGDL